MASIIAAGTTSGTSLNLSADTSGVLQLATNGTTTAVTIDTSQNVGIGTNSPNGKLEVVSTSAGANTNVLYLTNLNSTTNTAASLVFGASNSPTNRNAVIRAINNGSNSIGLALLTSNGDAPAERMRVLATGNILSLAGGSTSATGTGIAFPATQDASSNANTLDDYEEGTWTPTYSLGSGSGTFTTGTAVYTKIGRVVTLAIRFVGSGVSSAANLAIGGLPFPFANSNSDSSGGFREYTTLGNLYILSFGSSTDVQMQRYDNNNGLPNGGPGFSGSFTYTTNT